MNILYHKIVLALLCLDAQSQVRLLEDNVVALVWNTLPL